MLFKALAVFASRDINLTKVIFLVEIIFFSCIQKPTVLSLFDHLPDRESPTKKASIKGC